MEKEGVDAWFNLDMNSMLGTDADAYLKSTADRHKVFAELADLSTFFIPRSALPELPDHIKRNLGYHFQS